MKKRLVSILLAMGMLAGMVIPAQAADEIVFWNFFTGPDGENMQNLIDGFNATEPAFKIKSTTMAGGDLSAKIPTVVNSGTGIPDLVTLDVANIALYQEQGLLEPVTALTEYQPELKKENYNAKVWEASFVDGEQYTIPLDMGVVCLVYNVDLLNKYAPNALDDDVITMDEIKEMIPAASADGIVTWPHYYFSNQIVASLLVQQGGTLFTDVTTPNLTSPEMVQAVTSLKEIYDLGGSNVEGDDSFQTFLAGEAIFLPTGIWDKNALDKGSDFEWGLTNMPAYSADKFVNAANSNHLAMLKSEERSDEKEKVIADFLEYIRQNTLEWARSGMVPASVGANDEAEYQAMKQYFFVATPERADSIWFYTDLYNGYATGALGNVMADMLYGNISIEDGLNQAQKEAEDKIAQN